jgi:CRP/FNR family transcriptional regulator, cyclic AMP receptor protein
MEIAMSSRTEPSSDPLTAVLLAAPLLEALDSASAAHLQATMTRRTIRRGHLIFAEGQKGDRLFVVLAGKVKISRSSADGRENILALLGPSELFGEVSLFDPGPRTATATALTDATMASLDHDELREWLRSRPEVAEQLLAVLARRLRRTNEAMADLVFSDVPGRVAKALLDLARRFGQPTPDGVRVQHDLTQEELAQLVGASRETVNKALADFATRGWLRLDARSVLLLDRERLAHRAR